MHRLKKYERMSGDSQIYDLPLRSPLKTCVWMCMNAQIFAFGQTFLSYSPKKPLCYWVNEIHSYNSVIWSRLYGKSLSSVGLDEFDGVDSEFRGKNWLSKLQPSQWCQTVNWLCDWLCQSVWLDTDCVTGHWLDWETDWLSDCDCVWVTTVYWLVLSLTDWLTGWTVVLSGHPKVWCALSWSFLIVTVPHCDTSVPYVA